MPLESSPAFVDRRLRLKLCGGVQILIGGLWASIIPLALIGVSASAMMGPMLGRSVSRDPLFLLSALLPCCLPAIGFIWLGIGSFLARRWAYALTLVVSAIWVASGSVAVLYVVFVSKSVTLFYAQLGMRMSAATVLETLTWGFIAVVSVILPGGLFLLYRGPDVKATCEYWDRDERWTDRRPLPVLVLSVLLFINVLFLAWSPAFGFQAPIFGTISRGLPGAVVIWYSLVCLGFLIVGTYKLHKAAWWGSLIYGLLLSFSLAISPLEVSLTNFFRQIVVSWQVIDRVRQFESYEQASIKWLAVGYCVLGLGFLLYVRPFFFSPAGKPDAGGNVSPFSVLKPSPP